MKERHGTSVLERPAGKERAGDMIYRTLGKTGEKVSVVGIGGSHLGDAETADETTQIIRSAIDRGVTFLDNCWDYKDGNRMSALCFESADIGGHHRL